MKTLNELSIKAIARTDAFVTALQDEEGSEVAQAAGVAMFAAILITAVVGGANLVGPKVTAVFTRLAGMLN